MRPDLTRFTNAKLEQKNGMIFKKGVELPIMICGDEYRELCLKIPQLIEFAETLHDILGEGTMLRGMVLKTLNELK
ncbi:MAG: hypothetical protein LH615_04025 [Ferruginibacter sp.]|nr:hypothetical protein [Ferruginibacter sp.]